MRRADIIIYILKHGKSVYLITVSQVSEKGLQKLVNWQVIGATVFEVT